MKTTNIEKVFDIETGGFLHCEITGITEGLVSEVYEKQSEPRKERKSIIIGAPSYHNNMLEYYRMLEDKKQIVIHGGRQMGGKTAFMKHLAFAYQESLITGIPFELMLEKSKEGLLRKI